MFDLINAGGCFVSQLWRLEVANGPTTAVLRRRTFSAFRAQAIKVLALTPIAIDTEASRHAWSGTLQLADRFQLTPFDASYLGLAHRWAPPLATLDRGLCASADYLGISLFGV